LLTVDATGRYSQTTVATAYALASPVIADGRLPLTDGRTLQAYAVPNAS
jgi:putative alpha-1,2-mannosidase